MRTRKIILACDYRGVELRDEILKKSKDYNLSIKDIGMEAGSTIDYVDITEALVDELSNDPEAFGVIVCGSGQGVAIFANRSSHIRATMCRTPQDAESVRSKLNANVMCLGSKYTSLDEAMQCLLTFLDTPFKTDKHGPYAAKMDIGSGTHLAIRALIQSDEKVLLGTMPNGYLDFPGDYINDHESSIETLKRILKNEVGMQNPFEPEMIGVHEKRILIKGIKRNELTLFYKVDIDNQECTKIVSDKFEWHPLSILEEGSKILLPPSSIQKIAA